MDTHRSWSIICTMRYRIAALDREKKEFLKNQTFYGNELVPSTFKLCLMNLYLHNIGDITPTPLSSAAPGWRGACQRKSRLL